jgi:hypothetical protein
MSQMIKKATSIILLLGVFCLLFILLGGFSIAPGSFRTYGIPSFFTIYANVPVGHSEKLEIKNIMMVFSCLSIVVFYTGYLWGTSKRNTE